MRGAGVEREYEDSREAYVLAAFNAWQLGAGDGQTQFGKYLRALGLDDGKAKQGKANARKVDQQRAVEDAAKIMAADKRRRQAGG